MKRKFIALLTLVTLLFTTAVTVQAKETLTPEARFDAFVVEMDAKKTEKSEEVYAKWQQVQATHQQKSETFLVLVEEYAPDLTTDYEAAFSTHQSLHVTLFNTKTSIRTAYFNETLTQSTALKNDLFDQVTAGEMTYREATQALKAFVKERRDAFKVQFEAYRAVVQQAHDEFGNDLTATKALRSELKAAVAAKDTELAHQIIVKLYDVLETHIHMDEYKLEQLALMF